MSEYDWFGSRWASGIEAGGEETFWLAGPEATSQLPFGIKAYNEDYGSVGDAEWLVRHIGEFSVTSGATPATEADDFTLAWAVRYVPDVRVVSQDLQELLVLESMSGDGIITHGLMQGRLVDGVIGVQDVQAHNANAGLAGNAYDVESVKPSDDTSAVALTIDHTSTNALFIQGLARTLTRG